MQNYRVYPVRNARSFRPNSSGNQKKTTEAWRNGTRSLMKIYYNLEAVTSPNATEAFTTKNILYLRTVKNLAWQKRKKMLQ